jgi:hypothetical protein
MADGWLLCCAWSVGGLFALNGKNETDVLGDAGSTHATRGC